MLRFASAADFIARVRPADPVYAFRPHRAEAAARRVVAAFAGGEVVYAVKCNPHPALLAALARGGLHGWDVASLDEVRQAAATAPGRPLLFMNPVKPTEHVAEAYHGHGVREFAVDDWAEVGRVLEATGGRGITITVRLAVPGDGALMDLSGKFGAEPGEAVDLLRRLARLGLPCGLTFHVGSQCLDPASYSRAVARAAEVAREAGAAPVVLDIGGGFPAAYAGTEPPIEDYADAAFRAFAGAFPRGCALRCEPGRALAAEAVSVIVRVEAVRAGRGLLHLNDGVYGALSEIKYLKSRFPVRALRPDGAPVAGPPRGWALAGPTCDSIDMMPGPFALPAALAPGDYLEFGMMGAYSNALATRFNGFGARDWVELADAPAWTTGHPHKD